MVLVVADALFGQQGDGVIKRAEERRIVHAPIPDEAQEFVAAFGIVAGVQQRFAGLRPAGMGADQCAQQAGRSVGHFGQ